MKSYDVVVIGAGPGGYVNAIRSSQLGLKTAIVEKKDLGGVCLNVGCIPSKALLRNAEIAHTLRERGKEFGFSFENLQLDYGTAYKRSRQVSQRLTKGVGFLMKKNSIDVFMGTAYIPSIGRVDLTLNDGSVETLETKNIVLATGSTPMIIPGMDVDGQKVLNYIHAIMLESLPKSAVIIGGGAIGVEFSTIWNSYGVDVTLVEMLPHLLPNEDEEASIELEKAYKKRGINVFVGSKVKEVKTLESGTKVVIEAPDGEKVVNADITLVAIGFRPNSKELGLEALGVSMDKRGFIAVDDKMSTNIPGIWAVGDVTGKLLLAHVASSMGIVCAENIANTETIKLDYRMMPRATFSQPQIASFGYTESQAKDAGINVRIGKFPFQPNGKALGLGDYSGFAKLVVEEKTGEVLGASLIGPEVSELLPELTLAQANELTVTEIARNVHTHPTLSEVLLEAAEAAEGHGIHM